MRKILAIFVLCCVMIMSLSTQVNASNDSDISLCYENASNANATFNINNGEAVVNVAYVGYKNITTGARVTVKLEKRTLLVFWNDVAEWESNSANYTDAFEYRYPVGNGTYRATIRIEISGTNGATDVIEKEIKAST